MNHHRYFLLLVLFLSTPALAAPFVVTDPVDARCTHCGVFMDTQAKVIVPVTPQGTGKICKYDIQGIAAGAHTVTMSCVVQDPVWGDQESSQSFPLTFVKPSSPAAAPVGIRLAPQ